MVPPRLTLVTPRVATAEPAEAPPIDDAVAETSPGVSVSGVAALASADREHKIRVVEALLFASAEPMSAAQLASHMPAGEDIASLLSELQTHYTGRGISLVRVSGKWMFRTASDLSYLLERQVTDERRLSKAALETLAIVAYHQPVTRAEIEDIRGVSTSSGTLDVLMEMGWIRPRGRRRAPGRPITYGTTEGFLTHFSLDTIKDLPGLAELKGSGLLNANLPPGFAMPDAKDIAALMPDELPLEDSEETGAAAAGAADEPSGVDDQDALPLASGDGSDKPGKADG